MTSIITKSSFYVLNCLIVFIGLIKFLCLSVGWQKGRSRCWTLFTEKVVMLKLAIPLQKVLHFNKQGCNEKSDVIFDTVNYQIIFEIILQIYCRFGASAIWKFAFIYTNLYIIEVPQGDVINHNEIKLLCFKFSDNVYRIDKIPLFICGLTERTYKMLCELYKQCRI